jgi:hypothetical protein
VLRSVVLLAFAVAALAAPAQGDAPRAAALAKLKVQPTAPTVDAVVTISFRSRRRLPAHYHYELLLTVLKSGKQDGCAVFVAKKRRTPVGKGKLVSFRLSASEDPLTDGTKWCEGDATVIVSTGRNGDRSGDTGTLIGHTDFHIARAPGGP